MSDILKEALDTEHDAYQSRTVRLSAHYNEAIQETIAALRAYDFDATGATVYVLNSGGKNKSFHLDSANMDALMEAWIGFKVDLATAKEQEDQRKAGVLQEAMKLAESVPGLHIKAEEDGERWYAVHDWLHLDYRYAYSPDSLLTLVKEVKQKYDDEQVMLAEARKIAAGIDGTSIKSLGKGLYTLKFEGQWAHRSYETGVYAYAVLERLQSVKRDIDREAQRETQKPTQVAAEQGQHGDYSDLF
jgi:hypothetical protein